MFLSIDPLAAKYPGLSPYAYCANNPVIFVDPDGRELDVSNDIKSKNDITSLVKSENRKYISYIDNGDVSNVQLDLKGLSKDQINDVLSNDEGLSLINDVVSAKEKYLHEASDVALLRTEEGYKSVVFMDRDANGVVNASNRGLDSNNKHTHLPQSGYDGHLIISATGSWAEGEVQKSRSSMVFHEMAESYERTTNNSNYRQAHNSAIKREGNWHKQSIYPGTISNYNKPNINKKLYNSKIQNYINGK